MVRPHCQATHGVDQWQTGTGWQGGQFQPFVSDDLCRPARTSSWTWDLADEVARNETKEARLPARKMPVQDPEKIRK
jgi:hypothetical protein